MRVPPFAQVLATSRPDQILFGTGFGGTGGLTATPMLGPGGTGIGGVSPSPIIAFCSDEDIARRASADFAALVGPSQNLARGGDGTFAEPSPEPWPLTSASVNFANQGVQAYDVVHLTFPRVVNGATTYPGPAQLLAVDRISGGSVTLRRIGLASGMGDPPCPPGGFTSPVLFTVPTLYPQILDASRDIRQIYGLDERVWGRRTVDLYDLTQFIEACAFKVLTLRYLDMARSAGKDSADDYRAKSGMYRSELDTLLDRLAIHFIPSPLPAADNTRFSTRLVR